MATEAEAKGYGCLAIVVLVAGGLLWTQLFGKPDQGADREQEAKTACAAYVQTYMDGEMSLAQVGAMGVADLGGDRFRVVGRADHDGRLRPWECFTHESPGGDQEPTAEWT